VIRGFLQVTLSVLLLVGAIIGNDVLLLLLSAMAVVALLVWEAEARWRRRA
jgi:hypothetical protein